MHNGKESRLDKDEWVAQQLAEGAADLCRDAYVMHRRMWIDHRAVKDKNKVRLYEPGPRWDGGTVRGRTYKNIWPSVARFVLRHKVNVFLLARAVFDNASDFYLPPLPTSMMTSSCLDLYTDAKLRSELAVQQDFVSNSTFARTRLRALISTYNRSPRDAVMELIVDPQSQLSDLFRYCLARRQAMHKLAASWRDSAVYQFMGLEDAHARYWGEFIPRDLFDLVRRMYQVKLEVLS